MGDAKWAPISRKMGIFSIGSNQHSELSTHTYEYNIWISEWKNEWTSERDEDSQ